MGDLSVLRCTNHIEYVSLEYIFWLQSLAITNGPSTQPSYTESSLCGPTFSKPTYIEIPQPQAPPIPNHAFWVDLSTQISSLGTHMEELVVVSDTRFYSMEDRMD